MNVRQWLAAMWLKWIAQKDPNDAPVDSDFLRTTGVTFPLPDEARVPGEDTHAMYTRELRERYGGTLWRRLSEEAKERQTKDGD